jgi:hypothetical protein
MKTETMNRYRNPWHKTLNMPKPEFYENSAPVVFEYRGVTVYKLFNHGFDFVFEGCCITQRAGCDRGAKARAAIDEILDGNQPVDSNVADHLTKYGFPALTYDQYTKDWQAGLRE